MNGDNTSVPSQQPPQATAHTQAQLDGPVGPHTGNDAAAAATPAHQGRGERGPRRERGDRGPRGERGERTPRSTEAVQESTAAVPGDFVDTAPLASLPDLDLTGNDVAAPEQAATASEEQRRERRSRDRYGRDRRERGERGERGEREPREGGNAEGTAPAMMDFDPAAAVPQTAPAPAQDEPPRRSYFSAPAAADAAPAAPVAPVASPAPVATPVQAHAPAPAAAPAAVSVAADVAVPAPAAPVAVPAPAVVAAPPVATAAPVAKVADGMPQVPPFALPVDALHQVAAASGLQWVNSDADKIAAVQAAIAAEPKPPRVPRERPPAVVLDEGPLVLVETRRDLSAMALPFEQPPAA